MRAAFLRGSQQLGDREEADEGVRSDTLHEAFADRQAVVQGVGLRVPRAVAAIILAAGGSYQSHPQHPEASRPAR